MTVKLAIFDCDGTLVDGQAAVCAAMDSAFALAGLAPPPRAEVRRIVGLSLPQAVARLIPRAGHAQQREVVEGYKTVFRASRMDGTLQEPLFGGVRDLLGRLAATGWALAVATGKSDYGLTACLTGHGIIDRFVSLQTADRHPSKPDPAMLEAALFEAGAAREDAVMIGDTTFDMEMAGSARVRAIGVDWGYHEPEELRVAGAVGIADSMDALEELIGG